METKQQRERDFHNRAFAESTRRRIWGVYETTGASHDHFAALLAAEGLEGKRVLEYGSGRTAQAFALARQGAHATGIDISDVAVRMAEERAREEGLEDRLTFRVMDAEALEFEDDSFDLVCGSSVIHHLDLVKAYAEIARTLKPEGAAVFIEPMGHNPVINAFRRRTPSMRTADEHPLLMSDLEAAREFFGVVEPRFFHLASVAATPFRRRPWFDRLVAALDAADARLFAALPAARKHAWFTVFRLAAPRKSAAQSAA